MKLFFVLILSICIFTVSELHAAEFPAQGRLFLGSSSAQPAQINSSLTGDGMSSFNSVGRYGVEITYPLKSFLNVGMRYHKTNQAVYENPETDVTNYEAVLVQDEILLLARVPIYKQGALFSDIFVGVGGTNTNYRVRTATQSGELSKSAPKDWLASPAAAFGVSVGLGLNNIYGFIEAGYEYNKVANFDRTGTVSNTIQEVDLSSSYITFGILFDGIKASSK